jgi:citrate lyase subunit beta / citryl-CoA lyase
VNPSGHLSIIDAARTLLFVPGDRPDRFEKAVASEADIVVIDLEDSVAPGAKATARAAVAKWIAPEHEVMLRINACDTPWFKDDLALVAERGILGVMLPKAEPNSTTADIAAMTPTIALIESARGVAGMGRLDFNYRGLRRFALGDVDLSLDLGITAGAAVLDPVRLQMIVASRIYGMAPPIDGVSLDIEDLGAVERDARRARSLGFSGKLAIHPRQVAAILGAFRASAEEIAWAKRLIEVDRDAGGSAASLNGQMVDKPLVERARRLLASVKDV